MEGGLRLSDAVRADVLAAADRLEATCEQNRVTVLPLDTPNDPDEPVWAELAKRGMRVTFLESGFRVMAVGSVKGMTVSIDGVLSSDTVELPVALEEFVAWSPRW